MHDVYSVWNTTFIKLVLRFVLAVKAVIFDNTLYTKPDSTFAGFGILQCMSQNAVWDLSAPSISDMVSGWTQLKACSLNEIN